jgi:hypothetical protein
MHRICSDLSFCRAEEVQTYRSVQQFSWLVFGSRRRMNAGMFAIDMLLLT